MCNPCLRPSGVAVAGVARPLPLLRTLYQTRAHRVEMNVAADGPVIAFVLDHLGAVPPLEQVARSPPTPPGPDRIAREKALHPRTEIRPRRLDHKMKVISHDDVRQQVPAMADDGLLKSVDQPASVRVIADDFLAGISPCHHVIDGALEFNSQSSWHGRRLRDANFMT